MTDNSTRVVVIGAGYAGLMAALRLATKTDKHSVAITLVNASDSFNERVRNHQLISGQMLPERPLQEFLAKTRIRFQRGMVTELRPETQTVIVETRPTILVRNADGSPAIVVSIELDGEKIQSIWAIANPDKLTRVGNRPN